MKIEIELMDFIAMASPVILTWGASTIAMMRKQVQISEKLDNLCNERKDLIKRIDRLDEKLEHHVIDFHAKGGLK